MSAFKENFIISAKIMFFMIIVCSVIYPGFIWLFGQVFFHHEANGSLIAVNGKIVGSELIGQNFTQEKYFHSRPSASGYDSLKGSSSKLHPASKEFQKNVKERLAGNGGELIADQLMSSASGLDPHISPKNAFSQIDRIAKARNIKHADLSILIESLIEHKFLGILGNDRINVLQLNLKLDEKFNK